MTGTELLPADGRAVLIPDWASELDFEDLRGAIDWRTESVRMYGREVPVPRLIAYYGAFPYRYSGLDHEAREMPGPLEELRRRACAKACVEFNSVLANRYRNGTDGMGFHRDNEPEIDPRCIASVSVGATRRFRMRHRLTQEIVTIELPHGSLLLMIDCQEHWEHAVPKTKRAVGERINLTYRVMRPPRIGAA